MKKQMKRFILLFICIMMLFTSTIFASDENPTSRVMGHNLALLENFSIMYYVDVQNVPLNATQGLLVYDGANSSYTYENADFNITEHTESYGYNLYYLNDVAAKQITDTFYAVPYVKIGDVYYYGEIDKYSVLEYCLNKRTSTTLGKDGLTTLGDVVEGILQYGALVQKYLGYGTTRLATDTYYNVTIEGGTLSDGFTSGLFNANETVSVIATKANLPGYSFDGWYDSSGNLMSTDVVAEFTELTKNETFTAKYSMFSTDLEFESNGDGTCSVVGAGTWDGEELVIPEKSPDGETVTSIDPSAFEGGLFKRVTIPSTITVIGKKAFNGCENLTDVNYNGTAEEWAMVTIMAYNDELKNASITTKMSILEYTLLEDGTYEVRAGKDIESVSEIIIPEMYQSKTVSKIGENAFLDCKTLTRVEFPESVKVIGANAFSGANNITIISAKGSTPWKIKATSYYEAYKYWDWDANAYLEAYPSKHSGSGGAPSQYTFTSDSAMAKHLIGNSKVYISSSSTTSSLWIKLNECTLTR